MRNSLHEQVKKAILRLCVWSAFICYSSVVFAQSGLWTDEGNYDPEWPTNHMDGDTYLIRDEADLAAFARKIVEEATSAVEFENKNIEILSDMDLSAHYWFPIHAKNSNAVFGGILDGKRHTISNMHIDIAQIPVLGGVGMVGFIADNDGVIRNLNLEKPKITGTSDVRGWEVGCIAGKNANIQNRTGRGLIENCVVSGTENPFQFTLTATSFGSSMFGGLCGYNYVYATAQYCSVDIPISISESNVSIAIDALGGVVGDNSGILLGCYKWEETSGYSNSLGGIAGSSDRNNSTTITECHNKGDVTSLLEDQNSNVGGIAASTKSVNYCSNTGNIRASKGHVAGITASLTGEVNACYNTGNIYSSTYAAGIVANGDNSQKISNCYNTGDIEGGEVGGICANNGNIHACYNAGSIVATSKANGIAYCNGNSSSINNCLVLGKGEAVSIKGEQSAYRIGWNKLANNYANASLLLQVGTNTPSVATEYITADGRNGTDWTNTDNTAAPISEWSDEIWDKSNNELLPQLKYANGSLMLDQPSLKKSDYITKGENVSDPSDATLKSLSYKIGSEGTEIAVPGFRPDSFYYQVPYNKNQAGISYEVAGVANNPNATVSTSGHNLGKGYTSVVVTSEDNNDTNVYCVFGVEAGDEDKRYLVLNLGDHLSFELNGNVYRGDTVYKAKPFEQISGKLVPDKGYSLPGSITVYDLMMSFVSKGDGDLYTSDGFVNLTLGWSTFISASAIEGSDPQPLPVGTEFTLSPLLYEVLSENTVQVLSPDLEVKEWTQSECVIPDVISFEGIRYKVVKIADAAFSGYTQLQQIMLSEGLESIGSFAFDECSLTSLHLPSTVSFIGDEEDDWDLFGYCPKLRGVTVSGNSKTYSSRDSILYNKDHSRLILCPQSYPLPEVIIPDEVKEIMPYAFAYGNSVSRLTLPAGLEKIGEGAFSNSALTQGNGYIRCLGEQPISFENVDYLLLFADTQEEENRLLASNNGKYPCTLYVPVKCKSVYEEALFWKNFPIVEELSVSDEVTITGRDSIQVGNDEIEIDGVLGNEDIPTTVEKVTIDISTSSSETTTLVFRQVTVGDGQSITQETTTTTEVKKETNVTIILEGENVLGKLVNDGIATLLTGSKEGSLSNTVVVNNNTFSSETTLISKVEGAAPLDVTDPENKTVTAGSTTTLVASTTVESSYSLTFIWEKWVDGAWQQVGNPRTYEKGLALRAASEDKQEDRLVVSASETGLYRCRINNTMGDVSTTLTTAPAEVTLRSEDGGSTTNPDPTPSVTNYSVVLPSITGATTDPKAGTYTVKRGNSFSFSLTLDEEYDQSEVVVKVGDETLTPDSYGKYTIRKVTGDLTITVTGITLNNPTANAEVEQPIRAWSEGNTLHVYTAERATIRIYTFSGQLYKAVTGSGEQLFFGMPDGHYIIQVKDRIFKMAF